MKVFHVKKQLAALFMPGFLIGIIYVNFLAKKYVAAPDLFSEYFLDQCDSFADGKKSAHGQRFSVVRRTGSLIGGMTG